MSAPRLALIISVKPGGEARVAVDTMDALYPHDRGVRVEQFRGVLAVYSSLDPGEAAAILNKYPIRGVLAIRRVLLAAEGADPRSSVEALLREAAERGLKFSRLEVRARDGGSRELERFAREVAARLRLLGRDGIPVRVEVIGSKAALCVRMAASFKARPAL